MSWKILISAPYALPVLDEYRSILEAQGCVVLVANVRERLEEDDLIALVGEIDGIICGDDRITERVLSAAPRLKVISKWGTGIDSIDVEAAKKLNVAVRNTPNAFSEPVADTVLGYILQFARSLSLMDNAMREGRWIKPQLVSLKETTIGVIGVGNCGKAVARRAAVFGARVLGNDVVEMPPDFLSQTGIEMVSLNRLLCESDFISTNPTLNPETYHLINDEAFALMKPDAVLVNASRGPVVEEAALIRALQTARIAGAALDVFEKEPLPLDSPLREFPNCLLAPHNANSSPLAASRVHQNTIQNLLNELKLRSRT